jgi:putative FmdB family regulatory protein
LLFRPWPFCHRRPGHKSVRKIRGKTFIIQGFGRFLRAYPRPIYAYRCESCGFNKDVLQKISDAPLSDCPTCGKSTFKKQLTAAGFQLKGTGWYVTDFRNGSGGASAPASNAAAADKPAATSGADAGAAAPAASPPSTTAT